MKLMENAYEGLYTLNIILLSSEMQTDSTWLKTAVIEILVFTASFIISKIKKKNKKTEGTKQKDEMLI